MKKLLRRATVIAIILIAMLFFATCKNSDEQLVIKDSDEQLKMEDFLYDFDYMMQTMEDTFPYFGIAERRFGVDIKALGIETRAMIEKYPYSLEGLANELGISLEDMPELDEHIFWSIIYHEFFSHFTQLGHNFALHFRTYNYYKPNYTTPLSHYYTPNNYYAFSNHISQKFYQEQNNLFNTLSEEKGALLRFIFRDEPPFHLPDSIVETEIIHEDKIAYLKVSTFANFNITIFNKLRKFYSDIQNYEHLIIDIRDNIGGSTDLWRMLIMKPLWSDRNNMPNMPLYAFYRGSKLGKSLAEENIKIESQYSRYMPESDGLLTTKEIIEGNDLSDINEVDLQDLAYGVKLNTSIGNIEWRHLQQVGVQNISDYPFNGKIWLLTNENNLSAASLFARHAKEMEFATLVGEQTGGAYSTYAVHFTLPNTGIILRWDIDYLTDRYGRALNEFPTTPHHFNRPGMDALETVLQLIEEGNF